MTLPVRYIGTVYERTAAASLPIVQNLILGHPPLIVYWEKIIRGTAGDAYILFGANQSHNYLKFYIDVFIISTLV